MSNILFGKTTYFSIILIAFMLTACLPTTNEPPATIQAVADHVEALNSVTADQIHVLQDQSYGSGRIMLYEWYSENEHCLGSSYITSLNGNWQISDTLSLPCQQPVEFLAGYTDVSVIEANLGAPRQTVAFGTSQLGSVVRIIWADGLVEQVPLEAGSFLAVRAGRFQIERVELIDASGNLITIEDWTI
ncbi:MAG: hypothetical protein ACI9EW_000077 [Cellvibrionaceae bacterium]|jgi:hypothetical protein